MPCRVASTEPLPLLFFPSLLSLFPTGGYLPFSPSSFFPPLTEFSLFILFYFFVFFHSLRSSAKTSFVSIYFFNINFFSSCFFLLSWCSTLGRKRALVGWSCCSQKRVQQMENSEIAEVRDGRVKKEGDKRWRDLIFFSFSSLSPLTDVRERVLFCLTFCSTYRKCSYTLTSNDSSLYLFAELAGFL